MALNSTAGVVITGFPRFDAPAPALTPAPASTAKPTPATIPAPLMQSVSSAPLPTTNSAPATTTSISVGDDFGDFEEVKLPTPPPALAPGVSSVCDAFGSIGDDIVDAPISVPEPISVSTPTPTTPTPTTPTTTDADNDNDNDDFGDFEEVKAPSPVPTITITITTPSMDAPTLPTPVPPQQTTITKPQIEEARSSTPLNTQTSSGIDITSMLGGVDDPLTFSLSTKEEEKKATPLKDLEDTTQKGATNTNGMSNLMAGPIMMEENGGANRLSVFDDLAEADVAAIEEEFGDFEEGKDGGEVANTVNTDTATMQEETSSAVLDPPLVALAPTSAPPPPPIDPNEDKQGKLRNNSGINLEELGGGVVIPPLTIPENGTVNDDSFGDFGEATTITTTETATLSMPAMTEPAMMTAPAAVGEDDFGDFGGATMTVPAVEVKDFGDFGEAKTETATDAFGDFGEVNTEPTEEIEDEFGDFGDVVPAPISAPPPAPTSKTSSSEDVEEDFGDFGETATSVTAMATTGALETQEDSFGDFGEAAVVKEERCSSEAPPSEASLSDAPISAPPSSAPPSSAPPTFDDPFGSLAPPETPPLLNPMDNNGDVPISLTNHPSSPDDIATNAALLDCLIRNEFFSEAARLQSLESSEAQIKKLQQEKAEAAMEDRFEVAMELRQRIDDVKKNLMTEEDVEGLRTMLLDKNAMANHLTIKKIRREIMNVGSIEDIDKNYNINRIDDVLERFDAKFGSLASPRDSFTLDPNMAVSLRSEAIRTLILRREAKGGMKMKVWKKAFDFVSKEIDVATNFFLEVNEKFDNEDNGNDGSTDKNRILRDIKFVNYVQGIYRYVAVVREIEKNISCILCEPEHTGEKFTLGSSDEENSLFSRRLGEVNEQMKLFDIEPLPSSFSSPPPLLLTDSPPPVICGITFSMTASQVQWQKRWYAVEAANLYSNGISLTPP